MSTNRWSRYLHRLYFAAAILILIFALLVTLMRLLTPIAKRYQPDIEMWSSQTLGKAVIIGDISTGWHNLNPVIELKNIDILDAPPTTEVANSIPKKILFHVNSVRVSVAVLSSLWHRQLIFNQLIFDGMHLNVHQNAHQQWQVEGLTTKVSSDPSVTSTSQNPALAWLLAQHEIAVQNLNADIQLQQYPSHTIHNLKLILRNKGNTHYLRGQIIFNDTQHSSVNLAANIIGTSEDLPHLAAKIYLSGNKLHLANWLGTDNYYGLQILQGNLSFQIWGDWQAQHLRSVQSTFNLQNLQLEAVADPTLINVQHFSGNVLWEPQWIDGQTTGWQVTADKLQLTIEQHTWPTNKLGVFVSNQPGHELQTAQIAFVQLPDLVPLLTHVTAVPAAWQQQIQNYNPQGQVKNFQLTHQGKLNDFSQTQLLASLQNVGINRVGNIPGVQNLSADVNLTATTGSVKLHSTDTIFDFGKLFAQPLTLQQLNGVLQWQHTGLDTKIQGLQLDLQHPNMSLQSNFSLDLPNNAAPNLRLLAQFTETDMSKIKQFLPISILPPSVVSWLDQAFVSGTGAQGSMVLNGPLNQFPFLHGEGQFIVHSFLKNVGLHFAPDWPTINHLGGELTFNRRAMFFKLTEGDLYQIPITQLTAKIADMGQSPQAYLKINGNLEVPNMAQAEAFIFHSPLNDSVGKNLAGINLQGQGDLHLKLTIPLTSGDTLADGQLNLKANTLTIPSLNLAFTQLTGLINFTDSGLSSPLLMANFFQHPLTLSIKTTHEQGERITAFDINSILSMNTVQEYFALPKLDFLNGSTEFKALLTLNSKNDAVLKLNTDLQGVSINLPAPFGKAATDNTPLSVTMNMKSDGAPLVKIAYEKLWKLVLGYQNHNNKNSLATVLIHFGPGLERLPTQTGIYVHGMLRHFYWDEWQPILQTYFLNKKDSAPATTAVANTANSTQSATPQLKEVDLFIDRLAGFKQIIEQAQIYARDESSNWLVTFDSPQITGQLAIPHDPSHPLIGQFKKLYLRAITQSGDVDVKKFDPTQIIPINVHADDFHYGSKQFGAVTFQAQPIAQGMKIQKLAITNPTMSLDTQGSWIRKNNQDYSSFTGSLTTNNLGALLQQQKLSDHINEGQGSLNFALAWPDSPEDFTPQAVVGNLTLDFKSGAIIGLSQATNEKIGVGKVLNALSIQNIYDRLTFQNKSIDSDGFSFTEMKGTLNFQNGDIFTNDGYINGQVAQIFINGRIGLRKENYDLLIKVIPYLTSSLPVIATIAGGPIVGAITWAADKVVSVGIEKTVVYQYRITGPWADPVVVEAK